MSKKNELHNNTELLEKIASDSGMPFIDRLHAAMEIGTKAVFDRLNKSLSSPFSVPAILSNVTEVGVYLSFVARGVLKLQFSKEDGIAQFYDPQAIEDVLEKLSGFVNNFGTHSIKLTTGDGSGTPSDDVLFRSNSLGALQRSGPYVSSTSIRNSFYDVGASPTAALIPQFRFLVRRFQYGGETLLVLSDLRNHGVVLQAMRQLGVSEQLVVDFLSKLSERQNESPPSHQVQLGVKILAWPVGDDEYVQISPVTSYGLFGEMAHRVRSIRNDHGRIVTRAQVVGGSNSQNSSIFGGVHTKLSGSPPTYSRSDYRRITYKMKNGYPLIRDKITRDQGNKLYNSLVRDNRRNAERAERCVAILEWCLNANIVSDVRKARAYHIHDIQPFAEAMNSEEVDLVFRERGYAFSPKHETDPIIDYIMPRLIAAISRYSKENEEKRIPISDELQDFAETAIRRVLVDL